jgi:hypothetical protein
MEEKKLTDEQDNLLIEFDGYGFTPTITMPNSEEYAIEWKKRLIRVFDSQKAEIERLKKANEELTSIAEYQQNSNIERWGIIQEKDKENAELQKQVDKAWFEVGKMCMEERKDTAKEIYEEIDKSDILVVQTQEYGEIEVVPIERLKEIIKRKAVEAE